MTPARRLPSMTGALVALVFLAACAGTPDTTPVPALPAVRLAAVEKLIAGGAVTDALQDLDYLRREKAADLPEGSLDRLQTAAVAALGEAFAKAVAGSAWPDALRLARSAAAAARPELAGDWTEKRLLLEVARQDESRGDLVAGLIQRLRALDAGDASSAEVSDALAAAKTAGNASAARDLAGRLRGRGVDPGPMPDERASSISEASNLSGKALSY